MQCRVWAVVLQAGCVAFARPAAKVQNPQPSATFWALAVCAVPPPAAMAEEAPPNEGATFMMMDDILERLKMLDYEANFRNFKPLTHTHSTRISRQ